MNTVCIGGRLGKDPILRSTKNGKEVCNFSIAVDDSFIDSNGERQQKTQWFQCVAWNGMAKAIANNFPKGRYINVVGLARNREYEATTDVYIPFGNLKQLLKENGIKVDLNENDANKELELEVPVNRRVTEIIVTSFEWTDAGRNWDTKPNHQIGNTTKSGIRIRTKKESDTSQQQLPYEYSEEIPF